MGSAINNRASIRGFTLIELMIVMVLAGIVLSLASLSTHRDPHQDLQEELERLSKLSPLAHDEARLRSGTIYLEIDCKSYRWVTYSEGEFRPILDDDLLKEHRWSHPVISIALHSDTSDELVTNADTSPIHKAFGREWINDPWEISIRLENDQATIELDQDPDPEILPNSQST